MARACSAESAWINFAPRIVKFLDTLKTFDICATVRQISRKGKQLKSPNADFRRRLLLCVSSFQTTDSDDHLSHRCLPITWARSGGDRRERRTGEITVSPGVGTNSPFVKGRQRLDYARIARSAD